MASVFDEQRGRLCTVCYHQFSCHGDAVPRILTCGHSFCTGCLSRLLGQLAHGHIRCPTCKGDTLVPGLSNDINKLSKNFGVLEILESIDEGTRAAGNSANQIPLCADHDNEPMKVFCIQDDQLICIYCQVYGSHQGHQCQLVSILAEENRKTIRSFIERLGNQKDSMVAVSQAVTDTAGAVQIKEDRLMYEVTRHFEMLRRKLYQRENQVKILLRNRISAKVMLLDKQKRKLHELISKVDQLSALCQSILTGQDYELVQQKTKLETDFQSLSSSIEERDLRPCTKDDLHCHLDPSMLVQVSSHGMLVKEPVYRPSSDILTNESVASASTTITSVSETVGSTSNADKQEGDCEHIEWPAEMEVSGRNTRQQNSSSDVIIICDDMDLETAASSSDHIVTAYQQQPQQHPPACCCQASSQHTCASSSSRQACSTGSRTQSGMNRHRAARGSPSQNLRRLRAPVHVEGNPPTNREEHSSSSDEDDNHYLSVSELSDMELERPLRSAWTNRGGWSSTAAVSTSTQPAECDTPSVLVEGTPEGAVGEVPSRVGMAVTDDEGVVQENAEEPASAVHGGGDKTQRGEVEERRDEGDPWEVNATLSPRRLRRQGHSSSQHQRFKGSLVCSVFSCTSSNCSFYVRCKNCSRLFCQKCVSTSISARRCYKRPRGHSFMYIPLNPGNTSANNNQQLHQRIHHLLHHSHQRGACLRQYERQPGTRHGPTESQTPAPSDSWYCLQCLTVNQSQTGIQRCVSCGQINESSRQVEHETELMTFPLSQDSSAPQPPQEGDRAQGTEAQQNAPDLTTESHDAEITLENFQFG
ncbi:uncharacterized protein LOC110975922 [Acanthaster planci]|uniref:Uncharacterized protein LOC110975922 n=1 Tax=Acanthaster planci TaxID=133434 RepID=A0A8B7XXG7_ACAPL|nr:uncharacterized protein LOC110975922 [Acanthaster planci]XP_022084492.1 uncharacterized protein LOC110975922 [Acanthaster planci]